MLFHNDEETVHAIQEMIESGETLSRPYMCMFTSQEHIDEGAERIFKGTYGYSLMINALESTKSKPKTVQCLIDNGVDVTAHGNRAVAMRYNHTDVVEILLANGASM